jgi:hypothetical protein
MNCPDDVAEALLEILESAVFGIRVAGWNGNAEYCALEADHVHNLPAMLREFSRSALEYYLDATRPAYIEELQQVTGSNGDAYRPLWAKLEHFLARD